MDQPDIVFLVLDTQRADRLGCYGSERGLTPNLDRLAAGAARFDQAIAPAQWTIPSHASMFTGLYPTAHQVTQSNHSLGRDRPHLVETLRAAGYQTVGFCNNPLVGILNNGFKRGFDRFYNYGGAIPSLPQRSSRAPWPVNRLLENYTQLLRRISYPIQNFFARSDLAFRISINSLLTPLWSRFANFKGQNERSIRDVSAFLAEREARQERRPLFLFINLMETHLPFWPPGQFVEQVAPYMRGNREAQAIMSRWNREAYRWQAPLAEPLGELEARVLSDMYDAEVAYQDHYLGQLVATLARRRRQADTLTVVVSDHGDGLGEHGYMGHAFVAYQELVHVPLLVHWPRQIPAGTVVSSPVSTRRVYHTMLNAAGPRTVAEARLRASELRQLSLLESIRGREPERNGALAEVYPPLNFVKAIEHRQPELLTAFRCLSRRRALVQDNLKLIQVDDKADELFDLHQDPAEQANLRINRPVAVVNLTNELERQVALLDLQRDNLGAGETLDLAEDEHLLQRLRALGYVD